MNHHGLQSYYCQIISKDGKSATLAEYRVEAHDDHLAKVKAILKYKEQNPNASEDWYADAILDG